MADATAQARQEVERARRNAAQELDQLGPATRAALDIPAKVRSHPLQTVGVAGGAAFLLLGGPKRAVKAVEKKLFPRRAARPPSMLPKDVDKTIDRLPEEDREQVRAHLERDFAAYLRKEHTDEPHNARHAFWKTYDLLVGVVGLTAGRELAKKLFEIPKEVEIEQFTADGDAPAGRKGP